MRLDKASHKALLIMNIVLSVLCLLLVAFCVVNFAAEKKARGRNIAINSVYLNVEHPDTEVVPGKPTIIYVDGGEARRNSDSVKGDSEGKDTKKSDKTEKKEVERSDKESGTEETMQTDENGEEVVTETKVIQVNYFPISHPVRMVMMGEVGKSGELTVQPDGAFKGSQKGSVIVGGEKYITETIFNGKLSNIRQTGAYTYAADLSSVVYENEQEGAWEKDGEKYLFAEAAGMKVGEEFLFYVPGAKKAELPEAYFALNQDWDPESALETFALYCPKTELGYMEQK